MITIKKIIPPTVDLYAPDGTYLGNLNEYEFLDAKVQIKELQETGYYCVFDGMKIRIDRNGRQEEYPANMFHQLGDCYMSLLATNVKNN